MSKKNKNSEFDSFVSQILEDKKKFEKFLYEDLQPTIEKIDSLSSDQKECAVQLVRTEKELNLCKEELNGMYEKFKKTELERDAWKNVSKINFSKSERLGHYKWMFWCVVLINVLEPIIIMVVMFVHNHFKGV